MAPRWLSAPLSLLLLFAPSFHLNRVGASSTFHDLVHPDTKPPPFRTLSEVELERFLPIIGASPGQSSIAFINPRGEKCFLEHRCETCVSAPQLKRVRKSASDCVGGKRGCARKERSVTAPREVEICQEKLRLECPEEGGCALCPTFCRPLEQEWCEQQLEVKEDVRTWEDCSGERCRTFRRTVQRVERKRSGEMRRRCERKTVTMAKCAPINCHFVLADNKKECMSTNKLANIKLFEEQCEMCEPELTEEIVPRFICSTRVSTECHGHGGTDRGKWTQRCEEGKGRKSKERRRSKEPRKARGHDEMINAITHIFEMAAGPVRELFGRSGLVKTEDNYAAELGDIVTGNSATTTEDITLVHPIQDLIVVNDRSDKNATEQLTITRKTVLIDTGGDGGGTDVSDYGRAEEDLRNFFFSRTTETAPASSSVYFEPEVTRTTATTTTTTLYTTDALTPTETPSTTRQPETTDDVLFYTDLFSSSTTESPPSTTTTMTTTTTTSTTTENRNSSVRAPKADETAPISSVYFEPEVRMTTTNYASATAIQAATSNPEVIWYGEWESAEEEDYEDYETSYFYYTDVNPSSTSESPTASITSTTSSTTTTATTTSSTSASPQNNSQGISTETQVRLCLLHGICDLSYLNEYVATSTEASSTTTRVTTTPTATTTSPATTMTTAATRTSGAQRVRHQALLQAQIQRCILTPRHCNTNMVVAEQTRSAAREAARNDRENSGRGLFEILSTTKAPPTAAAPAVAPPASSALEFARRCVQTGNCDIGDMMRRGGKQTGDGGGIEERQLERQSTTTEAAAARKDEPVVVAQVDRSTVEQKVRRCLFHGICY